MNELCRFSWLTTSRTVNDLYVLLLQSKKQLPNHTGIWYDSYTSHSRKRVGNRLAKSQVILKLNRYLGFVKNLKGSKQSNRPSGRHQKFGGPKTKICRLLHDSRGENRWDQAETKLKPIETRSETRWKQTETRLTPDDLEIWASPAMCDECIEEEMVAGSDQSPFN